ncbi:MAG: PH domain-containing protein [Clostridiales bacterium]|nr:PH domain-containing protein [Clostridiales bacterium]
MKYEKLGKKALTCMYVKSLITFFIVTVVILVVNGLCKEEWPGFISYILYGIIGVQLLYVLVAPKIRYERYRYRLSEEGIEVREGLIVVTTQIVPIERLHKIEVSSGPIFRAFGLKEVLVTTAGGELKISYLDNSIAERISEYLRKRINTIVAEEREAANASKESAVENFQEQNMTVQSKQQETEAQDGAK